MSQATITLTDNDGEIKVTVEFDPPITTKGAPTGAQYTALRLLDVLRNEELEDDED